MDISPQLTHFELFARAAKIRGLTCKRIGRSYCFVRSLNIDMFFKRQIPDTTSMPGFYACTRRTVARRFLKDAKIPVPMGKVFTSDDIDRAWAWGQALDRPLVIKPSMKKPSETVVTDLADRAQFNDAWANAAKLARKILVEEKVPGRRYRLLVVGGCFVAFTTLDPRVGKGEGPQTISEPDLWKENEHEPFTDGVHTDFRVVAERVASILPTVGLLAVDVIVDDIAGGLANQKWSVINTVLDPNLIEHDYLTVGTGQDFAGLIIDYSRSSHLMKRSSDCLSFGPSTYAPGWKGHNECFTIGYAVNRQLLKQACWARNLSVKNIDLMLWSISDGATTKFMCDSMPESTSLVTRSLTSNKDATKRLLRKSGINAPKGKRFTKDKVEDAVKFFQQLPGSAVVKPIHGSGGKGVTVGIEDETVLREAFGNLDSIDIVVEEHISGSDYRLLVVQGRFVAAMRRIPANVVGDGEKGFAQLISEKNEKRKPDPHLGKAMIKIDPFIRRQLESRGITSETVLPKGELVQLQGVANIGSGGDSVDVTEFVHPEFQDIVEQAWRVVPPSAYCGFDLIAEDVALPAKSQDWSIIEVNVNADVALHHFPWEGQARDAAGVLIDSLFPHAKARAMETRAKVVNIVVSGKVQKVGFRKWTRTHALRRALDGWVRNILDDRVEAVFSGMPVAVDDIVRLCRKGPSAASVEKVDTSILDQKVAAGFVIEP